MYIHLPRYDAYFTVKCFNVILLLHENICSATSERDTEGAYCDIVLLGLSSYMGAYSDILLLHRLDPASTRGYFDIYLLHRLGSSIYCVS